MDAQFSITGDSFLVATGSAQVKLYDRDGAEKSVEKRQAMPQASRITDSHSTSGRWEYSKGDMYIRDMRNTE